MLNIVRHFSLNQNNHLSILKTKLNIQSNNESLANKSKQHSKQRQQQIQTIPS